ncbi:MAG: AAA family ATPase [Parachlamydiaceae bacterium]|nr:MAG: AAA family ATPase [Parachlamydiaceae bacterium]
MRTAPIAVPPLTDYSKKYQNSFSSSFIGREDIFQNILRIWQQNKHPILVGEPGVGKTTIIMELGRRVAMGEIKELKGKTLFAGSAALINEPDMMGASAFPRVIKTLNAYRDNVILALDEAHALASNKNNLTLLRSTTDNSTESLRYCLFATTPDGYESFEKMNH